MDFEDTIRRTRSCRRFRQETRISAETLNDLIGYARLAPSTANRQPLKYILSNDTQTNRKIFATLSFGAYLREWDGPREGERPAAYIVILHDKTVTPSPGVDHGIAAYAMLLGAASRGLGGCIVASVKKKELSGALGIDGERFEVLLVVALGEPNERIVIEDLPPGGSIEYYRDSDDVHHVPKRGLNEVVLRRFG